MWINFNKYNNIVLFIITFCIVYVLYLLKLIEFIFQLFK